MNTRRCRRSLHALALLVGLPIVPCFGQNSVKSGQYSYAGGLIEIRVESELQIGLYDRDGSSLASLKRKKPTDAFKGESLTLASDCPGGRGRAEVTFPGAGRLRLRSEKPNARITQTPVCMVPLLPASWNEFELTYVEASRGEAGGDVVSTAPKDQPPATKEELAALEREEPGTSKVLDEFHKAMGPARRGAMPIDSSDPIVMQLVTPLMPGSNPLTGMPAITGYLNNMNMLMAGADPGIPYGGSTPNYALVVSSALLSICGDDAKCLHGALGVMVSQKGSFAEVISKRPRSFLTGDSATVEAKQKVSTPGFKNTMGTKMLTSMYGEDILRFQGDELMKEIKRRDANLTDAEKAERSSKMMVEFMASPDGAAFTTAFAPNVENFEKSSRGTPAELEFLSKLQPGEIWVDFYRYRPHSDRGFGASAYLMVVAAGPESIRFVKLGAARVLEDSLQQFHEAILTDAKPDASWALLKQRVWEPLRSALPDGTTKVIVSPDGPLSLTPWASLAAETAGAPMLTVMPSAYQFHRARAGEFSSPKTLFGIGGLDYGAGARQFSPLAGSRDEIRQLEAIVRAAGWKADIRSGRDAGKAAVEAGLLEAGVVHLATHGYLPQSGVFKYSEAGIALSGANQGVEFRLSAVDIAKLDLRKTQLVTVSACNSGSGKPLDGQGVMGFQTAFAAAGARTILASLWRVPDRPTAILMGEFYKGWLKDGLPKSQALRRAQEMVRRIPEYAAVVNWGAWTLIGEGW